MSDNQQRKPCFNFQKGNCKFGDSCKFLHDNNGYGNSDRGNHRSEYHRNSNNNQGRLSGGSYNDNRNQSGARNSYGGEKRRFSNDSAGSQSRFKAKKPASMIEHMEPVLEPAIQMAKELLTKIGDMSDEQWSCEDDDLVNILQALATAFVDSGDLVTYSEDVAELFSECLSTLPMQSPIIATVLALISKASNITGADDVNSEQSGGGVFASVVVDTLMSKFHMSWICKDVLTCKIVLRSFATLFNCVSMDETFLQLLNMLLDTAYAGWVDRAGKVGVTNSGKTATYLLGTVIPWVVNSLLLIENGRQVLEKSLPLFARVLSDYQSPFCSTGQSAIFHLDNINQIDDGGVDSVQSHSKRINVGPVNGSVCWDTLWEVASVSYECLSQAKVGQPMAPTECVFAQWLKLEDSFRSANIAHHNNNGGDLLLSLGRGNILETFHNVLLDEQTHPSFDVRAGTDSWLQPCYSIFDANSSQPASELCQKLTAIEKYLLKDYYRDIIHFFAPIVREDGTKEGTLETLCLQLHAVAKLFRSDRDIRHVEYVLVEVLLINLTTVYNDLSVSVGHEYISHANRYSLSCRLLLDLCRLHHAIPPILALGVSVLFQYGNELDTIVWRQLGSWLSFHLVNTKMSWPYWSHWADELQLFNSVVGAGGHQVSVSSGKDEEDAVASCEGAILIKLVLDRCARCMVREQIIQSLPVQVLQDVVPDLSLGPQCSLLQAVGEMDVDNSEIQLKELEMLARALLGLVEQRVEAEALDEWLETANVIDDLGDGNWKIKILVQALFQAGRATPSNTVALLDRYADSLRSLTESDAEQRALLGCVTELFVTSRDGGALNWTIDAILRRSIVSPEVACQHFAEPYLLSNIHLEPWLFTHLVTIVDRSVDKVRACVKLYLSVQSKGVVATSMSMTAAAAVEDISEAVAEEVIGSARRGADNSDEIVDYEANDEDDPRSSRFHRDDTTEDAAAVDEPASHMGAVLQALAASIKSCRVIYKTIISSLLRQIVMYRPQLANCEQTTVDLMVASLHLTSVSLLMYVLRSLHGANRDLLPAELKASVIESCAAVEPSPDEERVNITLSDLTLLDCAGVERELTNIEHKSPSDQNQTYRRFVDSIWRSFVEQ